MNSFIDIINFLLTRSNVFHFITGVDFADELSDDSSDSDSDGDSDKIDDSNFVEEAVVSDHDDDGEIVLVLKPIQQRRRKKE